VDECLALSEGLFQITNEPFDINAVFEQAEFVVCHAGMGMVNRALYHGCPMLVIPTQLEQINTSIRLVDMQVAVSVNNSDTESDVERKVSLLFRDSQYSKRAQEFSANNQFLTPQSALSVVADLCEDLLD
ncbi:MAG TPA: glycosyltransferase, partial [Cellvibrio sp.]|nr:glycosyltransferase [Cellvibrio sp.]